MPLLTASPGNHLHLRAARTIKVSGLTECADLKFFYALNGRSNHTGGHRTRLISSRTGEILEIADGVACHIVGIVAAVYGEGVLIHVTAGDITSRCNSWCEPQE